MGDRALVQFVDSSGTISPAIYLHWSGSEVSELLGSLREHMRYRYGDASYASARFVGICHESIPGNLSLGMFNMPERLTVNDSHGDAGCFIVDCDTWEVEVCGGYGFSHLYTCEGNEEAPSGFRVTDTGVYPYWDKSSEHSEVI